MQNQPEIKKEFASMTVTVKKVYEQFKVTVQSQDEKVSNFIMDEIGDELIKRGFCARFAHKVRLDSDDEPPNCSWLFRLGNRDYSPSDPDFTDQFGELFNMESFGRVVDNVAASYPDGDTIYRQLERQTPGMLQGVIPQDVELTADDIHATAAEGKSAARKRYRAKQSTRYNFSGYEDSDRAVAEIIRQLETFGYYVTYENELDHARRTYAVHAGKEESKTPEPLARFSYIADPLCIANRGFSDAPIENCRANIRFRSGISPDAVYFEKVVQDAVKKNNGILYQPTPSRG